MQKNPSSKSGFFHPRAFFAFILCLAGISLAMFGVAAPPAPRAAAKAAGKFQPVIVNSFSNGISRKIRDLPLIVNTTKPTKWEVKEIRPTHPMPPMPKLPVSDPVHQKTATAVAMPTPIITFNGINQAGGCGGCIPPDPNGAVGPNHFVEMVNSAYAVYSKAGVKLAGPVDINALWANLPGECQNQNDGDPVVVYDHLADRWVLSQFAVNGPYDECVAVSTSPDPTGSFYVYDFRLSDTVFHDYPKLAVWPDAYYMTTNEFPPNAQLSQGVGAFAMERDKMLLGQPARLVFFDLGLINIMFASALPSHVDGPPPPLGSPNYFIEVDSKVFIPPNDAMRIWKFHVDWSNPTNSTLGLNGQPNFVLPVPDFVQPPCLLAQGTCIPQMGSPYQLDVLGDRIMFRLAYRNFGDHESLVMNQTVLADARTGIRWYEVRSPGTAPTIFQTGTFAPVDTLYRWMGSIAMDKMGNIAVGYSTSSPTTFPSLAYAGRLATDPLGQLPQSETQMFAGLGAENVAFYVPPVGRWGDYSALTVDPTDGCTFWYVNEYMPLQTIPDPGAPWETRIGSFKFANCVASGPIPTGAVSRKMHATAGTFDINLPLTGTPGVECRSGGANGAHRMVVSFAVPVTVSSANVSSGTGSVSSVTTGGNQVFINLTGVTNVQTLTVKLVSVNDGSSTGDVSVPMAVLLGDTTGNRATNSSDVSQTKANSGMAANGSNFRTDTNVNGLINSSDVAQVKAASGTGL